MPLAVPCREVVDYPLIKELDHQCAVLWNVHQPDVRDGLHIQPVECLLCLRLDDDLVHGCVVQKQENDTVSCRELDLQAQ